MNEYYCTYQCIYFVKHLRYICDFWCVFSNTMVMHGKILQLTQEWTIFIDSKIYSKNVWNKREFPFLRGKFLKLPFHEVFNTLQKYYTNICSVTRTICVQVNCIKSGKCVQKRAVMTFSPFLTVFLCHVIFVDEREAKALIGIYVFSLFSFHNSHTTYLFILVHPSPGRSRRAKSKY